MEEVSEAIEKSIKDWLAAKDICVKVVNFRYERTPDLSPEDHSDWELGVNISLNQAKRLPEILDYFYDVAVKNDRDFVVGYFSEYIGISEDIAFFGTESGKPDTAQITEFLGINC